MKHFFCIAAAALFALSSQSIKTGTSSKSDRKALACDIHNFLVLKDSSTRSAGIRSIFTQIATTLLPDFFIYPFSHSTNRNPYAVMRSATHLLTQGDISGEGFYTIFSRNGYQALANSVLEVSNAYNAPPGVAQLLDELEENNVLLFVASNIGSDFYHRFCTRNEEISRIFSHFDPENPGITIQFIDSENNSIAHPIKKPEPEFFKKVVTYAQSRGILLKNIYFGDDNETYVAAAQKAGINGIHFNAQDHGQQTAYALRKKLTQAGLLKS